MQFGFSKKLGYKNPSTLDLDVSRMRPRVIRQERERLYDDALREKMVANMLKDENVKLKTKVHILESELLKKERLVDDLLLQQDSYQAGAAKSGQKIKLESHLAASLKKKIRELQSTVSTKQSEVEALKRHIKSTRFAEIEIEMKLYIDECSRLRQQLEEVIRSKDTFADPQEVRIIEERFQQQDLLIGQLRGENNELVNALNQRDQELMQQPKKAPKSDTGKLKRSLKERERELNKVRNDLQSQKTQNEEFRLKIEEMVKQRQTSASVGRPATSHHDDGKVRELNGQVKQLQEKLTGKETELVRETQEKTKYKELYERYQGQVALMQAQSEEGKPLRPGSAIQKPQSAVPKKTIPRVDAKQLEDVFLELKLKLQVKGFHSNQIKDYFFKPYSSEQQVSVRKLKDMFEFNGLTDKKSELLARYLIEPRDKA